jgi:hypothetical protein
MVETCAGVVGKATTAGVKTNLRLTIRDTCQNTRRTKYVSKQKKTLTSRTRRIETLLPRRHKLNTLTPQISNEILSTAYPETSSKKQERSGPKVQLPASRSDTHLNGER